MGDSKIKVLTCLMPLIMSLSKLPEQYKKFYLMLSENLTQLWSPCFNEEEIDLLYWRMVETLGVKEGLFPPSYFLLTTHMLIDLPKYIKRMGPLNNWNNLASESAQSVFKQYMNQGGINPEYTCFNKLSEVEELKIDEEFSETNYHVNKHRDNYYRNKWIYTDYGFI